MLAKVSILEQKFQFFIQNFEILSKNFYQIYADFQQKTKKISFKNIWPAPLDMKCNINPLSSSPLFLEFFRDFQDFFLDFQIVFRKCFEEVWKVEGEMVEKIKKIFFNFQNTENTRFIYSIEICINFETLVKIETLGKNLKKICRFLTKIYYFSDFWK